MSEGNERFFLGDHIFVEFGHVGVVLDLKKITKGKAALFFNVPLDLQNIPISNEVLPFIKEGNEVLKEEIEKYLEAITAIPGSKFFGKRVNFKKTYFVENGVFSTVAP